MDIAMADVTTSHLMQAKLLPVLADMYDEADFEAVYRLHFRSVYRYILGLTRSAAEADDVTAEAFERAYRAWSLAPPIPAAALPWLLLTARRIATDRWRRARRMASLWLSPAAQPSGAGESRTEFWLWFDALAEVLSDRQREVLLLRYERDLNDADIGMIMGLHESGVRSLVARAIAALRSHPELL